MTILIPIRTVWRYFAYPARKAILRAYTRILVIEIKIDIVEENFLVQFLLRNFPETFFSVNFEFSFGKPSTKTQLL